MSRRRFAVSLAALALPALFTVAATCHAPPAREALLPANGARSAPTGSECPTLIRRAAPTPEQRRFLCRLNQIENRVTHRPLVAGNDVSLLIDGPATHSAQLRAIAQARHHVHLVAYILDDDEVGAKYRDALTERARAGVRVRMMFDSVGGLTFGRAYRKALEDAGVEVHEYAPINPLEEPELWRLSRRNHRKLLVVDGRVAFTGGIGISDTYSKSPLSGSSEHGWRDTHIRIMGPAAAEFQRLFFEDWEQEVEAIPRDPGYWPRIAPRGQELVRAIAKEGEDLSKLVLGPFERRLQTVRRDPEQHSIYATYLAAISESQSRIWITQAYFAPNREFLDAIERAARGGRDVRLLVPANSDVGLLLHASRHDYRSFIHNDEANAIIVGSAFAREMEAMFQSDLASSREVELAAWRERPVGDRLKQTIASMLKYWI
jgi:cardiolipin synthase